MKRYRRPPYAEAGSLPYREAGELMRLSHARLVEGRASVRAWRLAGAVWSLTAGYSKAWDAVFVDGLAELTGMDERSTRRAIKECVGLEALRWRPTQWRHGTPSLIGLPESSSASAPITGSPTPGLTGSDTGSLTPDYLEPRTSGLPGPRHVCAEWDDFDNCVELHLPMGRLATPVLTSGER